MAIHRLMLPADYFYMVGHAAASLVFLEEVEARIIRVVQKGVLLDSAPYLASNSDFLVKGSKLVKKALNVAAVKVREAGVVDAENGVRTLHTQYCHFAYGARRLSRERDVVVHSTPVFDYDKNEIFFTRGRDVSQYVGSEELLLRAGELSSQAEELRIRGEILFSAIAINKALDHSNYNGELFVNAMVDYTTKLDDLERYKTEALDSSVL